MPAQKGILYDVLRVRHRAEHPICQAGKIRSVFLEAVSVPGLIHSNLP